jgi:hypothetical protein
MVEALQRRRAGPKLQRLPKLPGEPVHPAKRGVRPEQGTQERFRGPGMHRRRNHMAEQAEGRPVGYRKSGIFEDPPEQHG